MVLFEVRRAKSLEDARKRIEYIYTAVNEQKIEEIARRIGFPLRTG